MKDKERQELENRILLKSSGELSSEEQSALEEILASDESAAEYAEFILGALPAAGKAPRDFVAEAIARSSSDSSDDQQRRSKPPALFARPLAMAAGIMLLLGLGFLLFKNPQSSQLAAQPDSSARLIDASSITNELSARGERLETAIAEANRKLLVSRYSRNLPNPTAEL
ncbi:MAG: hypothetical protein AAGD22_18100 [Verrucomicrobiota bacterium]